MDVVNLESRIALLENAYRKRRAAILVPVVAIAGFLALGQAPNQNAPTSVVQAERFILRMPGDPGPRAILGTKADGTVALALFRRDGKTAIEVGLAAEDRPVVALFDGASIKRAALTLGDADAPRLDLLDGSGQVRVSATQGESGGGLRVLDSAQKPRAVIGTDKNSGTLIIWDGKGVVTFQKP